MDDAYKREAYWALCPWCDEEKCIDHTTCKAIEEFAKQLPLAAFEQGARLDRQFQSAFV